MEDDTARASNRQSKKSWSHLGSGIILHMDESPEHPPKHTLGSGLTHLDQRGAARMVDVTSKSVTHRRALARGVVRLKPETLRAALEGNLKKGAVFEVARVAGILAAKRTSDLIPLCHPIPVTSIRIDFEPRGSRELIITAEATAADRTGVEMEALVAVATAALTVYDMLKGIERGIVISDIRLDEKHGGKSGDYFRAEPLPENES